MKARSAMPMMLLVAAACAGAGARQRPAEQKSTMLRGDRETSGPVKASAARPRPGAEPDRNPLEGDELALDEARARAERARAERAHAESHAESSIALEDFSHPACAAIPRADRRACPLTSVRWSAFRRIDMGVELDTDASVDPMRLRWQFLCHIAFARAHGQGACPLGIPGIDLTVIRVDGRTRVRLVAMDRSQAGALQRQVREVVNTK